MQIIEAAEDDLTELMEFYQVMGQVLNEKDFLPEGNKGGFPSEEMVSGAIRVRQQFIGREDGKIAAAYILNHECEPAYHAAHWQTDAAEGEYVVMHALRVLPRYGGRGYSRRMIEHAIQTAREWNQKAIRLDVLVGNTVPEKIYQSYGFQYVETVEICYQDIGVAMPFRLMELAL